MPINRSPPRTPTQSTSLAAPLPTPLHHSSSEPNITKTDNAVSNESGFPNITHRNKRKCSESRIDQGSQLSIFMAEIKNMFTEFKEGQEKKFERLCESVEEIKNQNTKIQATVSFLSQDYDDLKGKIENLEAQLESERKNNLKSFQNLEEKFERVERGSRSTCIEIRNIPIRTTESKTELLSTVMNIGATLNVPMQPFEVKDIFRIGTKDPDKKTVIVDFTTNLLKEKFIGMYKKYNTNNSKLTTELLRMHGPVRPIFISENLTSKMKRLFFLARDFANSNQFRFCWIKNGRIFIRKEAGARHFGIKDESDLLKINISEN